MLVVAVAVLVRLARTVGTQVKQHQVLVGQAATALVTVTLALLLLTLVVAAVTVGTTQVTVLGRVVLAVMAVAVTALVTSTVKLVPQTVRLTQVAVLAAASIQLRDPRQRVVQESSS